MCNTYCTWLNAKKEENLDYFEREEDESAPLFPIFSGRYISSGKLSFLSFDDVFPFYLSVMLKRQEIQSRGVITP